VDSGIVISYTAWFRRLAVALLVMMFSVDCGFSLWFFFGTRRNRGVRT
jgi:hypothetical protein